MFGFHIIDRFNIKAEEEKKKEKRKMKKGLQRKKKVLSFTQLTFTCSK